MFPYHYVLFGVLKSITLYLTASLAVCVLAFQVDVDRLTLAIHDLDSFADMFLASLLYAPGALLATMVLGAALNEVGRRLTKRPRSWSLLSDVVGGLVPAVKRPFYGVRVITHLGKVRDQGRHKVLSEMYTVIFFFWSTALLGYIAAGLYVVAQA